MRRMKTLLTIAVIAAATVLVRSQSGALMPAAKEWPAVSGDLGNTRYTTLTQINRDTLGKLKGAWQTARFDDGGARRAMPGVKDGMPFISAGSYGDAADARTGRS